MYASKHESLLQPTFTGYVDNTFNALRLFEACLTGRLHDIQRRPLEKERNQLVCSGCVFIYDEKKSGIKRWTDGVHWSPSRILGNFLIYCELPKPATKRNKQLTKPSELYPRNDSIASTDSNALAPTTPSTPSFGQEGTGSGLVSRSECDKELLLIGSMVDSYGSENDGLVKKTMSVTVKEVRHHLVSYYRVKDVKNHVLQTPLKNPTLRSLRPRPELTSGQNFRVPVDELDNGAENQMDRSRSGYFDDSRSGQRSPMLGGRQMYQPQWLAANNNGMEVVPQFTSHQPPANPGFADTFLQQTPYYLAQMMPSQSQIEQNDYATNLTHPDPIPSYPVKYGSRVQANEFLPEPYSSFQHTISCIVPVNVVTSSNQPVKKQPNRQPSPRVWGDAAWEPEQTLRRKSSSGVGDASNSIIFHLQIPSTINNSKDSLAEFTAQVSAI